MDVIVKVGQDTSTLINQLQQRANAMGFRHSSPKTHSFKRQAVLKASILSSLVPLSGCATMVEEAQKRGISMEQLSTNTAVVAGLGTAAICSQVSGGSDSTRGGISNKDARCLAAGVGVGLITKFASKRIFKDLSEKDQRVAIAAATESLDTGEKITVELPDSGETFTAEAVGDEKTKKKSQSIFADTVKVPRLNDQYASVGGVFAVPKTVNVRSGPSTQFDRADSLVAGSKVHVFGEPEGTGWSLVGKAFDQEEDWGTMQVPVAVGYVRTDLLKLVETNPLQPATLASVDGKQRTSSMRELKTSWSISCKTMAFEREGEGGKVIKDKSELCYGPHGPA